MSSKHSGWVKFDRAWLDNPVICKDADTMAVWLYFVCNAAFEPTPSSFAGKPITLLRGQLTAGRKQISAETGVNEYKVFRTTKCLISAHLITQQTSAKNSLYTVLCDGFADTTAQLTAQQMHNAPHTLKEDKEQTNTSRKRADPVFEQDSTAYKAAVWLSESICSVSPRTAPHEEKELQQWANDIDKLHRNDGHDWETIEEVMLYARNDSFWRKNVLSGDTLHRQFARLLAQCDSEGEKP